jgi:hypothetical protein
MALNFSRGLLVGAATCASCSAASHTGPACGSTRRSSHGCSAGDARNP